MDGRLAGVFAWRDGIWICGQRGFELADSNLALPVATRQRQTCREKDSKQSA
jgi:hypothetical protein